MSKMIEFAKKFFDITFWKFILVGVANTLFGYAVGFVCLNLLNLDLVISSAANYIFGSILSYFLNKYFTFGQKEKSIKYIIKFIVNILVCYGLSYFVIAKPVINMLMSGYDLKLRNNVIMLVGMCLFVGFNYIGQRFFAFKSKTDESIENQK